MAKVYGYEWDAFATGDLFVGDVSASDIKHFGVEFASSHLGFEAVFSTFSEAKKSLLRLMVARNADDELIQSVKDLKASYLPVKEVG